MQGKSTANVKGKKVYVGLSGGVDSSVSALLLKRAGYDVTGVFIEVWQPDFITCSGRDDKLSAMRVAAELDIPFLTLDAKEEYKKEVVDYMIREYKEGRTPNPDVMCNRHVKFGIFKRLALREGADYVATGHYARVLKDKEGKYRMYEGLDVNKDQSYFLWTLTEEDLSQTLFPVGSLEKSEVRNIAKEAGLSTFDKKDSQGLCFMGKVDVKEFLAHYIPKKRGEVVNEKGEVIGHHEGAVFYTIGERHGFTITKKTPNDLPYYVVAKDVDKNLLVVEHRDKKVEPETVDVSVTNLNVISDHFPKGVDLVGARVRYRQSLSQCTVQRIGDKKALVKFKETAGVAPGQSIVFYKDGECLGGGVIE